MKNKLINGLGLGALVLGLSGCSSLKNLSTDYLGGIPSELFVVNVDDKKCDDLASVFMYAEAYLIKCGNDNLTYIAEPETVFLSMDSLDFVDYKGDVILDEVSINGVEFENINSTLRDVYVDSLAKLNRDRVQYVWENRWR